MLLKERITTRELADRYTAVIRGEMPADRLWAWLAGAFPVVAEYLRHARVRRTGPPFARYTTLDGVVAVEAGFPVDREIAGNGLVEPSTLPDGHAAITSHVGGYDDLPGVYRKVRDWVLAHGHTQAGPHWEVYHVNPVTHPDPGQWRTEVVVPYHCD